MNLPIYNIVLDEELEYEVNRVSIVNSPAFESNFLKFSKNQMNFNSDEERKELLGAALIPDIPIYRNVDGREFYVVFNKETIRKISANLFKKGYNTSMNIEHKEDDAQSYIYQSYIIDNKLGLNAPSGLEDLPEGTWVIGVKVESDELWNDIKLGKRNGFSVEGLFGLVLVGEEETVNKFDELIKDYNEFNKQKAMLDDLFKKLR